MSLEKSKFFARLNIVYLNPGNICMTIYRSNWYITKIKDVGKKYVKIQYLEKPFYFSNSETISVSSYFLKQQFDFFFPGQIKVH